MTVNSVKRVARALVVCVGMAMSAVALAGPAQAGVDPLAPCDPYNWIRVDRVGSAWYSSIGSAAGKFNASSTTSKLSITLSQTVSRSTTLEAGASMSVGWGIAQVEASFSYSVTQSTSTGVSVTDEVNVPGRHYGYAQPKVEYRRFHVRKMQNNANCSVTTAKDYGYIRAITAYPFFAECVATSPCTPRP